MFHVRISNVKNLLLATLLCVGASSCINDAEVGLDDPDSKTTGDVRFVFNVPNSSLGRAESSAETSNVYNPGTKAECHVSSMNVYLFDSKTGSFVNSFALGGIQLSGAAGDPQFSNYVSDKVAVEPGSYNIFAIANGKLAADVKIESQEDLLNAVDAVTYAAGQIEAVPAGGFMMTNRGASNLSVSVTKDNAADRVTTVSITLERVVAKVVVAQKYPNFELLDKKGKLYATVKMTDFRIINLSRQFYLFRHTAELTSFTEPLYSVGRNFGDVPPVNGYVIDPYFFKKTLDAAKDFTNADGYYANALVDNVTPQRWHDMPTVGYDSYIYCLENGMYQPFQLNAFSTGVVFKARVNFAPDRVFNENKENLPDAADWPERMFYANYNFYTSVAAMRANGLDIPVSFTESSTDKELAALGVKCYYKTANYSCYYNYWIRHLDNQDDDVMGVMEYAIVRNNIYNLLVTKVNDLGSGTPEVDPELPNEYKVYLKIDFSVLPWVVRDNNVEL